MQFPVVAPVRVTLGLRPSAGAILALLALSSHADASLKGPEEAKQYSFEASAAAGLDRSLEYEPLIPFLTRDRPMEIRWMARERPGLHGYRLTVVIEGGALTGTVAHWTIDAGTGRSLDMEGRRAYRMRLPLRIEPGLQVHAALEAVRSDGERRLLAQQDATPGQRRGERRMTLPAGPRLTSNRADDAWGLVGPAACLSESAPRGWLASSSAPGPEAGTPSRRRACQALRDRGPPLRADPRS